MLPPITEIYALDNRFVLVTWVEPFDGEDLITQYSILIQAANKNYYSTTDCVSATPNLVTSCLVAMQTLLANPFDLQYNQLVKATVQAKNTNGWSDESEANVDGARIQTVPNQMAPVTRMADSNQIALHVQWSALSGDATGGSAIDSYNLQWDNASNGQNWFNLIGEDGSLQTSTDYQFSNDVFPGTTYKFRVRAHNVQGWSTWSNVSIIRSTGWPDKPDPVTTVINNVYVRITWVDPSNNYESIDKYDIRIRESDGVTFIQQLQYCDGTNPLVISRKYCEVPVTLLLSGSGPFKLVAG
jgi:hypothetical protein